MKRPLAIWRAASVIEGERIYTNATRSYGLSLLEFRCLYELFEHGPLAPGRLCWRLVASKQSVSAALKSLVGAGFVRRAPVPGDRRAHRLSLTEEGRRVAEEAAVSVDRTGYEDVRHWSPGETGLYAEMSAKLVDSMREERRL